MLRSMLDLVLGGVLEVSWSDLGRVLGGQDAPKRVMLELMLIDVS